MSIVVRFKPTNVTKEKYDESLRRLEEAGPWPDPDGLELHVFFGAENDLRVSEIWSLPEQFHAYGAKSMPILTDVGINSPTSRKCSRCTTLPSPKHVWVYRPGLRDQAHRPNTSQRDGVSVEDESRLWSHAGRRLGQPGASFIALGKLDMRSSPGASHPNALAPSRMTAWHAVTAEQASQELGVDAVSGLDAAEVTRRREQFGQNRLDEPSKEPGWRVFLRRYRDLMQLVLLGAAVVSMVALQEFSTGVVIIGLTVLNAVLGLNQEGKAAESVAALQKMLVIRAHVRRGGELADVPAEELVPGDVVSFEAGDKVPADGRLLVAATLEIEEAALTGESTPVLKSVEPVAGEEVALGDRVDMAYMNSTVTRGRGEMVVTATGMATEVGQISGMLSSVQQEKTPLTRQLDQLTVLITIMAGVALALVVVFGLLNGDDFDDLFLIGISLAIAAIPTGLPAVVTTMLSLGTQALAAKGAIVKRLRSVETLGSTSAICSDKTGTLTLNQMTARELVVVGHRYSVEGEGYSSNGRILHVGDSPEIALDPFLLPMALANDAVVRDGAIVGDPTEAALVVLAAKGGIDVDETRRVFRGSQRCHSTPSTS